jgi:acetolactate synthase-1/2/3 large subunit
MTTADAAVDIVHGGRIMAEALASQQVSTIFTLGGGHIVELLDGCIDTSIRVVDLRHEGAAALAAEGWALATGDPGVVAVTAGPGFTNALTGFVDAAAWNVPLVLIAGRTGLKLSGRGAIMDIDQRAVVSPVAKWAATCYRPEMIAQLTEEAVHRARSGRPGAVYLEVPHDVLGAHLQRPDIPAHRPMVSGPPRPSSTDVARAADALTRAAKPLVVAGGGAFWSGAADGITRLCESAQIPVTTTSSARGLVADSHPWCLGSLVHGGAALVAADVVVVLGSAFNANLLYGGPPLFSPEQTIIQVDIDAAQFGGNRSPDIALCGDVGTAAFDLAAVCGPVPAGREAWLAEARSLVSFSHDMWDAESAGGDGSRVHPGAMAREVARFAREACGDRVTLVADGGDTLTWALAYFYAEGPGRLLSTTTALGTLGVGMPFALAAGAARPGEPVIAVVGDGAFGLSAVEIDSAVRHGIPMVIVVGNNAGWGDVRHHQTEVFGREIGSRLRDSRYDQVAEALGGHGEHVRTISELRPALDRALASGLPAVVNVQTDPAVMSQLLRMMVRMGIM